MYKRNIEAGSPKNCCCGKVNSITYCDCVSVALVYLNFKGLRPTILLSAAQFSEKYIIEHKMYVFIFPTTLKNSSFYKELP